MSFLLEPSPCLFEQLRMWPLHTVCSVGRVVHTFSGRTLCQLVHQKDDYECTFEKPYFLGCQILNRSKRQGLGSSSPHRESFSTLNASTRLPTDKCDCARWWRSGTQGTRLPVRRSPYITCGRIRARCLCAYPWCRLHTHSMSCCPLSPIDSGKDLLHDM